MRKVGERIISYVLSFVMAVSLCAGSNKVAVQAVDSIIKEIAIQVGSVPQEYDAERDSLADNVFSVAEGSNYYIEQNGYAIKEGETYNYTTSVETGQEFYWWIEVYAKEGYTLSEDLAIVEPDRASDTQESDNVEETQEEQDTNVVISKDWTIVEYVADENSYYLVYTGSSTTAIDRSVIKEVAIEVGDVPQEYDIEEDTLAEDVFSVAENSNYYILQNGYAVKENGVYNYVTSVEEGEQFYWRIELYAKEGYTLEENLTIKDEDGAVSDNWEVVEYIEEDNCYYLVYTGSSTKVVTALTRNIIKDVTIEVGSVPQEYDFARDTLAEDVFSVAENSNYYIEQKGYAIKENGTYNYVTSVDKDQEFYWWIEVYAKDGYTLSEDVQFKDAKSWTIVEYVADANCYYLIYTASSTVAIDRSILKEITITTGDIPTEYDPVRDTLAKDTFAVAEDSNYYIKQNGYAVKEDGSYNYVTNVENEQKFYWWIEVYAKDGYTWSEDELSIADSKKWTIAEYVADANCYYLIYTASSTVAIDRSILKEITITTGDIPTEYDPVRDTLAKDAFTVAEDSNYYIKQNGYAVKEDGSYNYVTNVENEQEFYWWIEVYAKDGYTWSEDELSITNSKKWAIVEYVADANCYYLVYVGTATTVIDRSIIREIEIEVGDVLQEYDMQRDSAEEIFSVAADSNYYINIGYAKKEGKDYNYVTKIEEGEEFYWWVEVYSKEDYTLAEENLTIANSDKWTVVEYVPSANCYYLVYTGSTSVAMDKSVVREITIKVGDVPQEYDILRDSIEGVFSPVEKNYCELKTGYAVKEGKNYNYVLSVEEGQKFYWWVEIYAKDGCELVADDLVVNDTKKWKIVEYVPDANCYYLVYTGSTTTAVDKSIVKNIAIDVGDVPQEYDIANDTKEGIFSVDAEGSYFIETGYAVKEENSYNYVWSLEDGEEFYWWVEVYAKEGYKLVEDNLTIADSNQWEIVEYVPSANCYYLVYTGSSTIAIDSSLEEESTTTQSLEATTAGVPGATSTEAGDQTTQSPEATTEVPGTASTEAGDQTTQSPEATTAGVPGAASTEAGDQTTQSPEATTAGVPGVTSTEAGDQTTQSPEATTVGVPGATSTEAGDQTTQSPEATTAGVPGATSTEAGDQTTQSPEATTAGVPGATSTEAGDQTTQSPEVTTAGVPGMASTETGDQTTQSPEATTAGVPGTTSTEAGDQTMQSPEVTTAGVPGTTSTEAGDQTTQSPEATTEVPGTASTEAGSQTTQGTLPTGTSTASTQDISGTSNLDTVQTEDKTDAMQSLELSKAEVEANTLSINAVLKAKQNGKQLNLVWGKVKSATGYDVYVQYCGKKFTNKPVKTVKGAKNTKTSFSELNGKKLDTKKNFMAYVVAYKTVNGKKVTLGKTITVYIAGQKNTKYTNTKKIDLKAQSFDLKKGKKAQVSAKSILSDKKKKLLPNTYAKEFRYASSNKKVATVSAKGKIKAIGKGSCIIYVYAQNGYAKQIKVKVK